MATNRQDTLDPALLRPGRLDRKIEFPWPSRRERRLIFQTVTGKMNLGPDVDLEDCECMIRAGSGMMSRRRVGMADRRGSRLQTFRGPIGSVRPRSLRSVRRLVCKVSFNVDVDPHL
jgi:hypothetical protein